MFMIESSMSNASLASDRTRYAISVFVEDDCCCWSIEPVGDINVDVSESVESERSLGSNGGDICFRLNSLKAPEFVDADDDAAVEVGVAVPSVEREVTQRCGSRKI